ncbi:MAG: GGDEF domain-containing phosphodiesterase [Clostridiaceae bacterium]|nr:GGDEF domain-containing phosphodiesterase [Clostridiaceae bacterium]
MIGRLTGIYKKRSAKILIILTLIILVTYIVYLAGGTQDVWPHLMYVPIILSAFYFGIPGTIATALLGGLAVGPFMPVNRSSGLMQEPLEWIFRLAAFTMVGIFSATLTTHIKIINKEEQKRVYTNANTGLPNSIKLKIDLQELIDKKIKFSLIGFRMINMDDINRSINYDIGIKVVKKTTEILRNHFDAKIYSVFTNEFALVFRNDDVEKAQRLGSEFLKECKNPIVIDEFKIQPILKGGMANYPQQAETPDDLIREMGIALSCKSDEIGLFVYDTTIDQAIRERQELIGCLFTAVKNEEFYLVYQPKINLHDNNVTSVEALLRWDYSLEKQKNIGEIIQIAEDIGLINEITKFVMKKVIEQIGKWQGEGVTIKVALNMSLKDLRDDSLVIFLEESIKANNIPPSMIEIELTERGILENEKTTLIFLKRLKKLGIEIALDDFGTGYNSMIDLVKLPIDYVKIDKAFIDDITSEIHKILIESIISYSHRTGRKAIAEGVETKEQLDILKRMGCDYIQGYYFCKPVLPEDLKKYILH